VISGRNEAGRALIDVGATMTTDRGSNASAWSTTANRSPCCSCPTRARGLKRRTCVARRVHEAATSFRAISCRFSAATAAGSRCRRPSRCADERGSYRRARQPAASEHNALSSSPSLRHGNCRNVHRVVAQLASNVPSVTGQPTTPYDPYVCGEEKRLSVAVTGMATRSEGG
jgi:hypothetical protein